MFLNRLESGYPVAVHDPIFSAILDPRPSLLLVSSVAAAPDLMALAEGAGFRITDRIEPGDLAARLDYVVGADALLLDIRNMMPEDLPLSAAVHAIRAWPALPDTSLIGCVDMAGVEPLLAELGPEIDVLLCEPSLADIAAELCLLARRHSTPTQLHDIGRDSDDARLEKLSEEVRRLAQTIDRMTRHSDEDGEKARSVRDTAPSYTPPPTVTGTDMDIGRATVPSVSRQEVRVLLRARRLRDRYMPADLFADPAWDMILDLMAARLDGKRVSVSSLCIAAAVPPTTALRWITQLTQRGICVRCNDPADARRVFIALSDDAAENVAAWFAATRRQGLRFGTRS